MTANSRRLRPPVDVLMLMPEQLTGPEVDGLDEKAHMQRECNCEEEVEERCRGVVVPVLGVGTVWQGPRMFGVLFHTLNVKGCNRVRVPRQPCSVRINVINLMSLISTLSAITITSARARRDQSSRAIGCYQHSCDLDIGKWALEKGDEKREERRAEGIVRYLVA